MQFPKCIEMHDPMEVGGVELEGRGAGGVGGGRGRENERRERERTRKLILEDSSVTLGPFGPI